MSKLPSGVRMPEMTILADHACLATNDSPDLLNLESRLSVAHDILRHKDTKCPVTICVYGDWGIGKTSAMKWLSTHLDEWNEPKNKKDRGPHPKVYPVWFDPWKYHNREDVWRGIIAEVILALFRVKSLDRENATKRLSEAAKKFGGFLGKSFINALARTEVTIKATVGSTGTEAKFDGKAFEDILKEYQHLNHPEKGFLNQFEENLQSWVGSFLEKKTERMAIFIDDLDRCLPDVTLEVLEAIKLYLNIDSLIFVVGLDRNAVNSVVEAHYSGKGISPETSRFYLDKIFQVEIDVTPSQQQLEEFLKHQIENLNKTTAGYWEKMFKDPTLQPYKSKLESSIRHLSRCNPREVKRLLNNAMIKGRTAADNLRLLEAEEFSKELRFSQGVQCFIVQRYFQQHYSQADKIWREIETLVWLENYSEFLQENAELVIRSESDYSPKNQRENERLTNLINERYRELKDSRPAVDGKPIYWAPLENEIFQNLLKIPFSRAVAQNIPLARVLGQDDLATMSPNLGFLKAAILDCVASQLSKPVADLKTSDLASVNDLDLKNSEVDDSSIISLSAFPALKYLNLSNTRIADEGLQNLTKLKGLEKVDLRETLISDSGFQKMPAVNWKWLGIMLTSISDVGLEGILAMSQLDYLDLWDTRVSDEGLRNISRLQKLKTLDLGCTQISNESLSSISKLSNLENLTLMDTNVDDSGIEELTAIKKLKRLDLWGCRISDPSVKVLSTIQTLKHLDLSKTKITDAGVRDLSRLGGLEDLGLTRTKVGNEGLCSLSGMKNIQRLYLAYTGVNDEGILELENMKLTTLDLRYTEISDLAAATLSKISTLRRLDLSSTRISDAGLKDLGRLPNLERIDLSGSEATEEGVKKFRANKKKLDVRFLPELKLN